VTPEQQQRDRDEYPRERRVAEKIEREGGRHDRRDQRARRRYLQHHGDYEPDRERRGRQSPVERQHDACRGGDTLAALEFVEYRKQVAQIRGKHDRGENERLGFRLRAVLLREKHREPALREIAEQRQRGRRLVAGAQHIGRARIARAIAVRIGQREQPADDDGERNRADQIGNDDEQPAGHHEFLT